LGATPSTTGVAQSRINYSIKRSVLRLLPVFGEEGEGEWEGESEIKLHSKGSVSAPRAGGAVSERGGTAKPLPGMDEFHRRVIVGAVIEAEMDDTKGGTEWVMGHVYTLNAARATFAVKFKVQNDKETGEWIEEYNWEELGREWRFAKVVPKKERDKGAHVSTAESEGQGRRSSQLKGVQGAEVVDSKEKAKSQKATAGEGKESAKASDSLNEVIKKLRVGGAVEAEMDDSNGGTEWIQGVVQSIKAISNSFKVKFNVTNDTETGEWTEQYRWFPFPPTSCCLIWVHVC
jgi:hypothetical protein